MSMLLITQINMITNIILILSSLVALNFVLLIFSCNKTSKKIDNRKPPVIKTTKKPTEVATQLPTRQRQLAATGS